VAEQHRLDELRNSQRNIGEGKGQGEPNLRFQEAKHPKIDVYERHERTAQVQDQEGAPSAVSLSRRPCV
jgi:hypothetical protein